MNQFTSRTTPDRFLCSFNTLREATSDNTDVPKAAVPGAVLPRVSQATTSEQEKALLASWSKNQCCLLLSKNSRSPALQNSLKCLYSSGLIRRTTCKSGSSFRVWNVTVSTSLTLKNGTPWSTLFDVPHLLFTWDEFLQWDRKLLLLHMQLLSIHSERQRRRQFWIN